ncbi:MAG: primosomal protein N' [Candidatus Marinimicrobia bacterium]|nr:primosomal protein N' [Candidatus Neomarinimicrobiota bacterium]MBL7023133.1 primosomal protein N' [Candidatus Neomarinimicrobiota bacterium]MBL7109059.1 primosomal protein N' [Candidatus Neomarinimicrobiota bacterium]
MYIRVTFPLSSFKTFSYEVPANLKKQVNPGVCVKAPFGKQERIGFVLSCSEKSNYSGETKKIVGIHEQDLSFSEELWKTLEWISHYYITPLGKVLKTAVPLSFNNTYHPPKEKVAVITEAGIAVLSESKIKAPAQIRVMEALNQVYEPITISSLKVFCSSPHSVCKRLEEKGFIKITEQSRITDPFDFYTTESVKDVALSSDQDDVYQTILKSINKQKYSPFLLKGVTGSGKTEVYLKLAQEVIKSGKSVLVLVPEISLTPQVAKKFRHTFGDKVALWHSRMTKAEKGWTWQQLKQGKFSVVVGARSAIFAPVKNLGMIVVDEEQESSFKQESPAPRYNARDVSLVRGKNANATVILTSATPSLESHYNGLLNRLKVVNLSKRYGTAVYPKVSLVDMKNEFSESETSNILSRELIIDIQNCLEKKEQVILLKNRRGFSLIQQCRSCGYIALCKRCSVSLTYHRAGNQMMCHYCRDANPVAQVCGECGSEEVHFAGAGTQKVEEVVQDTFPQARILRMDIDTVRKRGAHNKILEKVAKHEVDILLGTQMIAKGLDFENVTLVGVINADSGLFFPDFRAGERTFQLIYQVAGRAGRHKKPGKAIVQTYNPDDIYIHTASQLDIQKFYNIALSHRQELQYPPFSRLSRILFSGNNRSSVQQVAFQITDDLRKTGKVKPIGPSPAPIERIQGKWRFHTIIKTDRKSPFLLHNLIYGVLGTDVFEQTIKGVRIQIDVDAISML